MKFLENIKQGFKRTIYWNKCRSEKQHIQKNNNLNYLIDPKFRYINRLFVLSFKNGNEDPTRGLFDEQYIPLVEIKYFNSLINNKPFFDQIVKNKQEAFEKPNKMPRKDDYPAGKLLDYLYHQNIIKLIGIDL